MLRYEYLDRDAFYISPEIAREEKNIPFCRGRVIVSNLDIYQDIAEPSETILSRSCKLEMDVIARLRAEGYEF